MPSTICVIDGWDRGCSIDFQFELAASDPPTPTPRAFEAMFRRARVTASGGSAFGLLRQSSDSSIPPFAYADARQPTAARMNHLRVPHFVALAATLLAAPGCRSKEATFDSRVRIDRVEIVGRDEQRNPVSVDVSLSWVECPGTQRQSIRSGRALAQCLPKLGKGEVVPVRVIWEKEDHGGYDWHVVEIAGCAIPPVDDDDSSFESIQDCHPSIQHGAVLGFHCDRLPEGELLEKCPWFRRQ